MYVTFCFLQLDLPRGVIKSGGLIDLKNHSDGLCAPTHDTLLDVLRCDEAFNILHGEGANLTDFTNVLEKTENFIKTRYPEIPDSIVKLFTKIKYHARIKALNEKDLLLRAEELKRKAYERKEAPKRLKTMRDFNKVDVSQRCFHSS